MFVCNVSVLRRKGLQHVTYNKPYSIIFMYLIKTDIAMLKKQPHLRRH